MSATLPVLRIKTAHSDYVIDQNKGTYTRRPREAEAADLNWFAEDGKEQKYQGFMSELQIGSPMLIIHADGSWLHSTPILEIDEVSE